MPLMAMKHEIDPAQEVRDRIGDISEVRIAANKVLVGIYERPNKTASGIYLSDTTRGEDQHQSKTGLVLKLGPQAFVDSESYTFHPEDKVSVGDWVIFKISDGWPLTINSKDGHCRMIDDIHIRGSVSQPDKVF